MSYTNLFENGKDLKILHSEEIPVFNMLLPCQARLDAMIYCRNIINIANYSLDVAPRKGVFYFSKTALCSCYFSLVWYF